MNVCVYCASSALIDPAHLVLAARVGEEIARRGHALVSGGGSVSCMGAVATAARAGGAHTLGVIPRALLALEVSDPDADELIVTETMRERKALMDDRADGFLTLPGGLGTLEELLEIWVARVLGMHAKPVVVLDPGGVFDHLRRLVDGLVDSGFVRPAARDSLIWTVTVEEALDALEAGAAATPPAPPAGMPTAVEIAEGE
ncbi:Cytokinin riboside 5'-monophosphate phosphoribohydrolase [Frankia canadensis]|uniref:Cytokinin riboside 5'-monophosphate phosphoribohydrolase n=1 Tax=Frankia canadensis TaxID=1836972 RepID=A0A2I2KU86_9ACTN|nr:TIGR00730 family Rossman fold protein [Frankia canadensis]SNQ49231.1 Cytokinin riboside 5'-monophosphate phosphoribohydrolase [Frankia canadensis]SOU56521.1 Cytokinin riboside 5'-monophosphate phosphoribohydrolase [Frankia canadensis]